MRESRTLEYKENLSSNTFLKTISAYANYGEGKIIFGINDQGNIIDSKYNLSDRKSTRLNSSHSGESRMPSSA